MELRMRLVIWQPEKRTTEVESDEEAWRLLTSLSAPELQSATVLEDWKGGREYRGHDYIDRLADTFGDEPEPELIGT